MTRRRPVLLVHGLGRTPVSMWGLGRWLGRREFAPEHFGYVAAVQHGASIVRRLQHRLNALAKYEQPYAVIGHSMGGLLLRAALDGIDPQPVHFVMLGVPNRSPRLARRLVRRWPYRMVLGDLGRWLASEAFYASLPTLTCPYTLVAGTAGGRGRWSPFGDGENDWIVGVDETLVTDRDRPICLPVNHTFMMQSSPVRELVGRVLDESFGRMGVGPEGTVAEVRTA